MIVRYKDSEGKVQIISDGTFETPVAVSSPRFSFPFNNERSVRLIEQDYVIRGNRFSQIALGTAHPTYPNAKLVEESGFSNLVGGLVQWTRRFLSIPQTVFIIPKTSNFSFPSFKKTEVQTTTDDEGNEQEEEVEIIIRENKTKVVPCEERVHFVDLSAGGGGLVENDRHVELSAITEGDLIYNRDEESVYEITDINSNGYVARNVANNQQTATYSRTQRGNSWNFYAPTLTFESITIRQGFSPQRTHIFDEDSPITWQDAYNLDQQLTESIESSVDYVSNETRPSIDTYIGMIRTEEFLQIEDTKIEQFMGHIYKVSETFTRAQ